MPRAVHRDPFARVDARSGPANGLVAAGESFPLSLGEDLITGQAQGNPLFIEEVVRAVIDAGIVHQGKGLWHVRPEIVSLNVPTSVQSAILSRVDRLDERLKHVLDAASVIGRVFRLRVLAHTLGQDSKLENSLWELEDQALLYCERLVPEIEYSFKHVIGLIEEGIAAWRESGAQMALPSSLAALAQALGRRGHVEQALRTLDEALALVEKNEEHCWEAELYRLKGELMLTREATGIYAATQIEDAELCFQQAIQVAQRQSAKSWKLRASISLAQLWHGQGKTHQARELLREVYDWFTEGFGTPGLEDARTLLEAMAES